MTEKEKAKAYDDAIERAKKLYGNGITEKIFSKLKEDDIERINPLTREEEIIKASEVHSEYEYNQIDFENGFITGARWADESPNLHWISVKESFPKQDEEVIVLCDELNTAPCYKISFGHIVDKTICKDYNGWNIPNVVYWFPMPKLLKE